MVGVEIVMAWDTGAVKATIASPANSKFFIVSPSRYSAYHRKQQREKVTVGVYNFTSAEAPVFRAFPRVG